jgi:hypothetical protein
VVSVMAMLYLVIFSAMALGFGVHYTSIPRSYLEFPAP